MKVARQLVLDVYRLKPKQPPLLIFYFLYSIPERFPLSLLDEYRWALVEEGVAAFSIGALVRRLQEDWQVGAIFKQFLLPESPRSDGLPFFEETAEEGKLAEGCGEEGVYLV